jgi:hypothetical protein
VGTRVESLGSLKSFRLNKDPSGSEMKNLCQRMPTLVCEGLSALSQWFANRRKGIPPAGSMLWPCEESLIHLGIGLGLYLSLVKV